MRDARLLTIVEHRLGHALLGAAEAAKIAVADAGGTGKVGIPPGRRGRRPGRPPDRARPPGRPGGHMARIVAAGVEAAGRAGVVPGQVDVVYLTGGSTGLLPLATASPRPSPTHAPCAATAWPAWRRAGVACRVGIWVSTAQTTVDQRRIPSSDRR